MVATTRSRSCASTRTLRPRLSRPADSATPPPARAALPFVSVKKEKDEDVLDKRRKAPCPSPRVNSGNGGLLVKKESETLSAEPCFEKKPHLLELLPASASSTCDYESLRLQRIAENKARLAALGVQKHAEGLQSLVRDTKPPKKPWTKSPVTPFELRRRSDRLKNGSPSPGLQTPSDSDTVLEMLEETMISSVKRRLVWKQRVHRNYQVEGSPRPANAPLPKSCPPDLKVSPVLSAIRCRSKDRGTLYDSIVGICCHFCRQKTLCSEEDCERCGYRDVTKTCLGKTDCSKCHSSTGVFCRACLKIRYGEEMEEVQTRTDWLCPHCSEEQGLNPYWICNSSICLTRRNIAPTGIAIYKARELGYKSVAHYLADLLEKKGRM